MDDLSLLRKEDLINNPTARVPVCLCLDTSGSMGGEPIDELNKGISLFYDAIREDEIALYSAEICIVTFGCEGVNCITDFSSLAIQKEPPQLKADGVTPMGEAVNLALDKLEERKNEYKEKGVDYYQPWLVLMSDGEPYGGDESELKRAIDRTVELVNNKKLTVFAIGIGSEADMETLHRFSPKRIPLKLQGLKFREFFAWISKSVSATSESQGGNVKLDLEGIKTWGSLD